LLAELSVMLLAECQCSC